MQETFGDLTSLKILFQAPPKNSFALISIPKKIRFIN